MIWGLKTLSIFDFWTIEHILSGLSIGSLVLVNNHKSLGRVFANLKEQVFPPKKINYLKTKYDLIFVLFLAYLWETFEHYLETGLLGAKAEYWFAGVEFWPNRLIADPLMLVLGYWIVKKIPKLVWPARVLSLTWLLVHIFIFPDSMYLHTIFPFHF
ncbi:MAG: hypothetical protein WCX08_05185 [Candidatus Buchananbacteria bacterium]|jgi:hypothetical protein